MVFKRILVERLPRKGSPELAKGRGKRFTESSRELHGKGVKVSLGPAGTGRLLERLRLPQPPRCPSPPRPTSATMSPIYMTTLRYLRPYVRESPSNRTMSKAHTTKSQFRFESGHVSGTRLALILTPLALTALYPSRRPSRYLHGASWMQGKMQCQFSFTGTFTEASRIFTDACFLKQGGKTRGKTWTNILFPLYTLCLARGFTAAITWYRPINYWIT